MFLQTTLVNKIMSFLAMSKTYMVGFGITDALLRKGKKPFCENQDLNRCYTQQQQQQERGKERLILTIYFIRISYTAFD